MKVINKRRCMYRNRSRDSHRVRPAPTVRVDRRRTDRPRPRWVSWCVTAITRPPASSRHPPDIDPRRPPRGKSRFPNPQSSRQKVPTRPRHVPRPRSLTSSRPTRASSSRRIPSCRACAARADRNPSASTTSAAWTATRARAADSASSAGAPTTNAAAVACSADEAAPRATPRTSPAANTRVPRRERNSSAFTTTSYAPSSTKSTKKRSASTPRRTKRAAAEAALDLEDNARDDERGRKTLAELDLDEETLARIELVKQILKERKDRVEQAARRRCISMARSVLGDEAVADFDDFARFVHRGLDTEGVDDRELRRLYANCLQSRPGSRTAVSDVLSAEKLAESVEKGQWAKHWVPVRR